MRSLSAVLSLALPGLLVACTGDLDPADTDLVPEPCTPTVWYPDGDGDGAGSPFGAMEACEAPGGMVDNATDCDDSDADQVPGAVWHLDEDGDGYGDPDTVIEGCARPLGHVLDDTDCDDTDPTRHPDASWFVDADGDGFGDESTTVPSCDVVEEEGGAEPVAGDCDDTDPARHPDANEVCDGVDNDCDDAIDDEDVDVDIFTQVATYRDDDGDGWGTDELIGRFCPQTAPGALQLGDCDDSDATIHPQRLDYNDGEDANCDGESVHVLSVETPGWRADSRNEGFTYGLDARDLDGDGWDELLIGEYRWGSNAGRVRLQRGTPIDAVTPTEGAASWTYGEDDAFVGQFLGLHPDLDGDGVGEVFVSAHRHLSNTGRVFRIPADAEDGPIEEVATHVWDHPSPGAQLGRRFLPVGDVMLVSALREVNYQGHVYLIDEYTRSGSSPSRWDAIVGADNYDRLGLSMADLGDTDGDGDADIALSAPYGDPDGNNSGEVYLFAASDITAGSVTVDDAFRTLVGSRPAEFFGYEVAAAGDVNGDGYRDIVVGSAFSDYTTRDEGRAWVVLGDPRPGGTDGSGNAYWTVEGTLERDQLGQTLLGPGDMDGDFRDDVLIAAPRHSRLGPRRGAVFGVLGANGPGTFVVDEESADLDLVVVGEGDYDTAGLTMVRAGDMDGDGLMDAFIGARGGYLGDGALYLLHGASTR